MRSICSLFVLFVSPSQSGICGHRRPAIRCPDESGNLINGILATELFSPRGGLRVISALPTDPLQHGCALSGDISGVATTFGSI
jgi:hypothetical protein